MIISSSKDVNIEYSELCDCDEIYIISIGDLRYSVSYRYWNEMIEPQIWLLGDEEDELICTTKKLSKTSKKDTIKSSFISYMLGKGFLKIKE